MSVKSKVIINTTQADSRILDDSDEIIQNDEFVGEMPKYEYIINKEISNNYNNNNYHDNIKFITGMIVQKNIIIILIIYLIVKVIMEKEIELKNMNMEI